MGEEIESIAESQVVVKRHIEEYLADLFGAQFAGENILFYLSYLLSKRPNDDSKDHPSLNSRKKLIKSFIEYGMREDIRCIFEIYHTGVKWVEHYGMPVYRDAIVGS